MKDYIRLKGGKPLYGEIVLRGAKNLVPKAMVATLLTNEPCTLYDVPKIEDVSIIKDLLIRIGSEIEEVRPGILRITNKNIRALTHQDLEDITGRSRIPILMCGPMISRFGEAVLPKLGGCNIGPRPIDFHVKALSQMGAKITVDDNFYEKFKSKNGLSGEVVVLSYPSVGATEQVLLAGVLASGITEIHNSAVEPEIMDLIAILQKMGAIISVDTDRVIRIEGVKKLGGYKHNPIPDRNEAASWACAAAATSGEIFIRNARQADMMTFLNKYRQAGGAFDISYDGITFYRQNEHLRPLHLATDVHPGFMTDWQQPFVVMLSLAHGRSLVAESVYEKRFAYTEELQKMGADIQVIDGSPVELITTKTRRPAFQTAIIEGPRKLKGGVIAIPDLRAGFTYVVAALAAQGETTITNFSVLGRGYEQIIAKLQSLGAEIIEIKSS